MKQQVFNPYLPSYEYIPDGEPRVFDGGFISTAAMTVSTAGCTVPTTMSAGPRRRRICRTGGMRA